MTVFTEDTLRNISEANAEDSIILQKRSDAFKGFQETPLEKLELFKKYAKHESYELPDTELRQGEIEFEMPKIAERVGISIQPIAVALGNPGLATVIEKIFYNEDKFSAFANAFFNTGYLVYVPSNVQLLAPIIFRTKIDAPIISKNVIVGGPNSKFTVLEEINSSNEKSSLYSAQIDIFAEESSRINYVTIQNSNDRTMVFQNKSAYTQRDSSVNICTGLFGGEKIRTRTKLSLQKTGASGKNSEIISGNHSQKFDTMSKIECTGELTRGESHSRGIFSDKSSALIKGQVRVEKGAKKSDTYLTQHGMLLSENAIADAIPCLEILEQDVTRATHSASVAPIDEDQVFYLLSRGLDDGSSRKLIIRGFLEMLLKHIDLLDIKEKFSKQIENKLSEVNVE